MSFDRYPYDVTRSPREIIVSLERLICRSRLPSQSVSLSACGFLMPYLYKKNGQSIKYQNGKSIISSITLIGLDNDLYDYKYYEVLSNIGMVMISGILQIYVPFRFKHSLDYPAHEFVLS